MRTISNPAVSRLCIGAIAALAWAQPAARAVEPPAAHACTVKPPIALEIEADAAALETDGACTVTLYATPGVDAAAAEAVFEAESGELAVTGPATVALGALSAGETYTAQTAIRLTGKGDSVLRCWVYTYDEAGAPAFGRSRTLHVVSAHGAVAADDTSDVAIKLALYDRLRAEKRIDAAAFDAAREAVLSGGAAESIAVRGGGKQGSISIFGTVQWTDRAGATHNLTRARVEILERDGAAFTVSGTSVVSYGSFFVGIDNADPEGNGRDVAVRVLAEDEWFGRVVAPGATTPYALQSSVVENAADGANIEINLTANNTAANQRAFSVQDAVYNIGIAGGYLQQLSKIDVVFPTPDSTSNYDGTNLDILRDDWIDWDVIHHEYGHYFMDVVNIESNPGGPHADENLAERIGKTDGVNLAWGEGFPTWYGTAGQISGGLNGLGVPEVGDTIYNDSIDATIRYDLESAAGSPSLGEDNEISVQRILFDLYDGASDARDAVALSYYYTYIPAQVASAVNLSQYWNRAIASLTMQDIVRYGCIFADHKVAPEPTEPPDGFEAAAPPTFKWEPNGAGPSYRLNRFVVEFWNDSFTTKIFESPEVNTPEWTPSQADWDTILAGADLIKWIVRGRNVSAPETGAYVSCDRTIKGAGIAFVVDDTGSMYEEIGGVVAALSGFIAAIGAGGGEAPVVNLITFKDAPSSRIASDDLAAVQAAVSSLFASGGGDCPEASVQGLQLASRHVKAGGRILFATDADAHKGLDIGGTIAALRAKGLRVDVLLTGSCTASWKAANAFDAGYGLLDTAPPSCNEGGDCLGIDKTPPGCIGGDCNFEGEPEVFDFPTEAIAVFSAMAAETGGVFAFLPEINSGIETRFNNTALDVMLGAAFPTVPTAEPAGVWPGATLEVLLRGSSTSFNATSTLAIDGGGIAVDRGGALSATEFLAQLTIAPDAAPGPRGVTITTGLGGGVTETAEGTGPITVLEATVQPAIAGVQPSTAVLGQTLDVEVAGHLTHFDGSTTADFDDGITVNSVAVLSPTRARVNLTIDTDDDALGYHDVLLISGGEFAAELVPGPFLVTSGAFGAAIPRIVSVAPSSGAPGSSLALAVTGENTSFANGVSIADLGAGIGVTSTVVTGPAAATVNIAIAADAVPGVRDVIVTTGAEAAALLDGFTVTELALNNPPVANAGPDQTVSTTTGTANVTLDGSASSDGDGTIAAYLWSGTPTPAAVARPAVNLGIGEHTFSLVVTDNDGANSAADTVVITVEDDAAGTPELEVTPTGSVDFGTVTIGDTGTAAFTLENSGGGTLTGTVSAAGGGFTLGGANTFSLAAGAETTVSVVFAPDDKAEFAGTLTVTPNVGAAIVVNLAGAGAGAGCAGCGPAGASPTSAGDWAVALGALALLLAARRRPRAV